MDLVDDQNRAKTIRSPLYGFASRDEPLCIRYHNFKSHGIPNNRIGMTSRRCQVKDEAVDF